MRSFISSIFGNLPQSLTCLGYIRYSLSVTLSLLVDCLVLSLPPSPFVLYCFLRSLQFSPFVIILISIVVLRLQLACMQGFSFGVMHAIAAGRPSFVSGIKSSWPSLLEYVAVVKLVLLLPGYRAFPVCATLCSLDLIEIICSIYLNFILSFICSSFIFLFGFIWLGGQCIQCNQSSFVNQVKYLNY